MARQITITAEYFKQYRQKLGFANQAAVKNFFGAKDVVPTVDFNYLKLLNRRLYEIIDRVNGVVTEAVKIDDLSAFKKEHVNRAFQIMKKNRLSFLMNSLLNGLK